MVDFFLSEPLARFPGRIADPDALQALAQAGGADTGEISGITIWVGLLVLLVICLAIVIRAFGRRRVLEEDKPPEALEVEEAPAVEEPRERKPSLKEIKAARAARLPSDSVSREALIKARQARKGASRVEVQAAAEEVLEEAPDAAEDRRRGPAEETAPGPDAVQPSAVEPMATVAKVEAPPEAETPPPQEAEEQVAPAAPEAVPAAPEPEAAEAPAPAPKSLSEGLEKTRSGFVSRLKGLFSRKKKLDAELVSELEEVLLTADIGVKTSTKLLAAVEAKLDSNGEVDSDQVWEFLRSETARILRSSQRPLRIGAERPYVILVIGVGKTTTIGKLASRYLGEGHRVLLVAGDTFRAAAIDQLQVWGERTGCEVFSGPEGRDASSVVFDGIRHAVQSSSDIVLVDTAGRLHTKVNLVEELKKVRRVCDKALEGAPHEVLLVLDANTGQNAINQAEMFGKEVGVTGIALTKLDGTAKGGVVIGISDELGVPVQFVGIGEQIEDLREFDADEFVEAIF